MEIRHPMFPDFVNSHQKLSMRKYLIILLSFFFACSPNKEQLDLLVFNAKIYQVNEDFSTTNALAINNGKIVNEGELSRLKENYIFKEQLDAEGQFIYPGFIDAHAHLYNYGLQLQYVDLYNTKSYDELVQRVIDFQEENQKPYIIGRGWDQNLWENQEFPTNDTLNQLFPDTPISLSRVDGHALLCNQAALDAAGIDETMQVTNGALLQEDGILTGVIIDGPMPLIFDSYPELTDEEVKQALLDAEKECLSYGLTGIADAGLPKRIIDLIDTLQTNGKMQLRIYAMISNSKENLDHYLNNPPIEKEKLVVKGVKVYADGALGSRGAALKSPYSDRENHFGNMVIDLDDFQKLAERISITDFQMNTHAIGDSANSVVLKTYHKILENQTDKRWRVEHAQVMDSLEYELFSDNILPSVQPTHAISDMHWAVDRLGEERIQHAYAYQNLLDSAGKLALGTDFPIEGIDPLMTFFTAIARQDENFSPAEGFQKQNAISREDALRGMTIWAAYANFQEELIGSLEIGKKADFIILDQDLLEVPENEILKTQVIGTYIDGNKAY